MALRVVIASLAKPGVLPLCRNLVGTLLTDGCAGDDHDKYDEDDGNDNDDDEDDEYDDGEEDDKETDGFFLGGPRKMR